MKKKFKDIKIGEYFGCYGDIHSNHKSPTWIVAIKSSENGAIEVDNKGEDHVRFLMNDGEELEYYGKWAEVKF